MLLVLLAMLVPYLQMFEQRHVTRDDAKQGIFKWMLVAHRDESHFLEWSPTKTMVQIEEIFEIIGERVNATNVPRTGLDRCAQWPPLVGPLCHRSSLETRHASGGMWDWSTWAECSQYET